MDLRPDVSMTATNWPGWKPTLPTGCSLPLTNVVSSIFRGTTNIASGRWRIVCYKMGKS
jgi:hypothetical protein